MKTFRRMSAEESSCAVSVWELGLLVDGIDA